MINREWPVACTQALKFYGAEIIYSFYRKVTLEYQKDTTSKGDMLQVGRREQESEKQEDSLDLSEIQYYETTT
ncbi:hypothetical protein TESG_01223 [Trichophyton tonsurans CBS 112818]|uniref:Uncharacterized protein n=1 Tax=Trichophyton tonsurans (strain CBS 112818) TaxID=647933 RepID=F2RQT4_TRIT1|nr:hypothetical protein TESG_01223 [Trichophyton tonsurans CBS 112818]